jgi:hypothetical protein
MTVMFIKSILTNNKCFVFDYECIEGLIEDERNFNLKIFDRKTD